MTDLIVAEKQETMTSSQLAELLGKEKKEINRNIKAMFGDEIDGGRIPPSLDSRGYVIDYHLPELESKMFVAKHDISYLKKITQFWIDNKKPAPKELTRKEILVMALEAEERAEAAEKKVAILTHVNKNYSATEIAKELNFKSAQAFNKELLDRKIQYKVGKTWVLYAKYANLGYTDIKQTELENGRIIYDRRWTGLGREWLLGMFCVDLEVV